LIWHSLRVDAANLHVDLLLSELQNSWKMSHLIPEHLPPDFTSFIGSVALWVQELNFFVVGE